MSKQHSQGSFSTVLKANAKVLLIYGLLMIAVPTILINSMHFLWDNSMELSEEVETDTESSESELDEDFEIFLSEHRSLSQEKSEQKTLIKERSFKAEMPPLLEIYTPPPEFSC
ncbi:hypothetical protein GYB22_04995 [bacterium]|nr:hypothetical protein [bacterium]